MHNGGLVGVGLVACLLMGLMARSLVKIEEHESEQVKILKQMQEKNVADRTLYDDLPDGHYNVQAIVNEDDGTALVVTYPHPAAEVCYVVNKMPAGLMEVGKSFQIQRSPNPAGFYH